MILYYGEAELGLVAEAFCTDQTWYGKFIPRSPVSAVENRIFTYIQFCIDWNERLHNGDNAADAEFSDYDDVIRSGLWRCKDETGRILWIKDAPVFFKGNEITWNCV